MRDGSKHNDRQEGKSPSPQAYRRTVNSCTLGELSSIVAREGEIHLKLIDQDVFERAAETPVFHQIGRPVDHVVEVNGARPAVML